MNTPDQQPAPPADADRLWTLVTALRRVREAAAIDQPADSTIPPGPGAATELGTTTPDGLRDRYEPPLTEAEVNELKALWARGYCAWKTAPDGLRAQYAQAITGAGVRIELDTQFGQRITDAVLDVRNREIDRLRRQLALVESTARHATENLSTRAEQAEELQRIAHETSNRSEAERTRAVQRAEQAESRLLSTRNATALHRKQLIGTAELYAVIEAMSETSPAAAQTPTCKDCGHPADWHDAHEGCVGPNGIGGIGCDDCACDRRDPLNFSDTEDTGPAATDTETTARAFAALHRSAEQDVSRIIDLYERWKAAGPPIALSMTGYFQWWREHLAELHDAILAPGWTPPPPGDTREQLPAHVLALIRPYLRGYTSTACQTAAYLASAAVAQPEHRAELIEWRRRMRKRCRRNQKYTGEICPHHTAKEN